MNRNKKHDFVNVALNLRACEINDDQLINKLARYSGNGSIWTTDVNRNKFEDSFF